MILVFFCMEKEPPSTCIRLVMGCFYCCGLGGMGIARYDDTRLAMGCMCMWSSEVNTLWIDVVGMIVSWAGYGMGNVECGSCFPFL